MFLVILQWQMPLYLKANHVWVFLLGSAPFLVLFCCFGDETQVWLGDLGVVLLCGGGVFMCLDLSFTGTDQLSSCTSFLTAYVSFRTVPQCIYGQSRGKKKITT